MLGATQTAFFRTCEMRGRAAGRRQVRRTYPSRPTMGVPTRPRMPIRGAGALLCRLRGVVHTHAARRLFWHMLVVGRYHGEVGHQPPVVRPRMGHETTLRTHSPPRTARDGSTRAPFSTARGGLCSTVLHERWRAEAQRFAACDADRLTKSARRKTFQLLSQWRRYLSVVHLNDIRFSLALS